MRKKMDEADLRKKTETNVFAEFLIKVVPTGKASNFAPPPRYRRNRLPQPHHHRLKISHMNLRNKNVLSRNMMKTKMITMKMIISLRMRSASMEGKMSVL